MSMWLVRGAGLATLCFAAYHAALPRLMNWHEDLESLYIANRKVVRALNIGVTYLLVVMGLLSLLAAPDLLSTALGRWVLWGLAGFWALRVGIQVVVFGYEWKPSYALTAAFVVMTVLYGAAVVSG